MLRSRIFSLIMVVSIPLLSEVAFSQEDGVSVRFGKTVKSLHVPVGDETVFIYPAFEDYAYMMFDVCDALGLTIESGNCKIFPMNGDLGGNAIATIIDGNAVIVYDRELSPMIGYDGAMGVIAHEIGHHYCGHLREIASYPRNELEADQFVGAAFRKMDLSLDQALALTSILDERPSASHPGKQDRVKAVTAGWNSPENALRCNVISNGEAAESSLEALIETTGRSHNSSETQ